MSQQQIQYKLNQLCLVLLPYFGAFLKHAFRLSAEQTNVVVHSNVVATRHGVYHKVGYL